jgi:hypothetical protein
MYAQILDSLNERFKDKGLNTITIAKPYSRFFGSKAFGDVRLLDGTFARAYYGNIILNSLQQGKNKNLVVNAWHHIVEKVCPKVIVGIQPSPELCIAAKSEGIEVWDLQHGVISGESYYGESYREEFGGRGWPDGILCWDARSEKWISENVKEDIQTRVVGNPWFLRFMHPRPYDELVTSVNKDLQNIKTIKPVILVTLQWG